MNYPDTDAGLGNPTQGPGNFPCPDDDFDGDSDNPGVDIQDVPQQGLEQWAAFPGQKLGIAELRDGTGELTLVCQCLQVLLMLQVKWLTRLR